MEQLLMTVSCICMSAALCEQVLGGSRFFPAVRLVLGMETALLAVSGVLKAWSILNG